MNLPSLHQQDMHRNVTEHDERTCNDTQADNIGPECLRVEAEGSEDRGTRDSDIDAILLLRQREEGHLVHN